VAGRSTWSLGVIQARGQSVRRVLLLALVTAVVGCATSDDLHVNFKQQMNLHKGRPMSEVYMRFAGSLTQEEHVADKPPHNPEAWFRMGACQVAVEYTREMGIVVGWRYISSELNCTEQPARFHIHF
jgi:hypothetical protein